MRIQIQTAGRQQGNILVVTLLTCFIIGMSLASYLTLVSSQNYSVMRSLAWNSAIPLVEAGAEEALTQLHHHGNPSTNATAYLANGWEPRISPYAGSYYKQRHLGDSYYEVYILPLDPPEIVSHGHVPVPLRSGGFIGAFFASLVANDTTPKGYVTRRVRLTTRTSALFAKGLVADGQINLNGNNITTDSFHSLDPNYSDNGKYPAGQPFKLRDNGDVATNSGLVDALNVGNANIKGTVATGPGGSVAIGPNVHFYDVTLPSGSGWTPDGGTVDGQTYDYILDSRYFELSHFTGKVLVTGDAVLHVTENILFEGNDFVELAPGASLVIYMSGESTTFAGNGNWNQNGSALALQYWGLPTNTHVELAGNGSFTGTVYAPSAALHLNGGGKDIYDFVGASISKTIELDGKVQFHYDEALADVGPNRGYIVDSWNEH
jgi:hypothetical protein